MKGPYSADYHGTHTSGIMASKHNKSGIAGMAPSVRYDFYNVFYGKNSEYTDSWTVAKAVDKAVANGATIINLSLGGDEYDKVLANSIKTARSKGVTIVASSGNDSSNKISFPASMKEVVAVGAVDAKHRIADFSNMNKDVKIVAPGVSVLSLGVKNQYVYMDGTSMAAPMVTSALALVKSVNPYLNPSEIDNLIAKMPKSNGKSYTELNVKRLLDATPQPIIVSSPQNILEPYVRNVRVKLGTAKKVKTSLALYQGSKKIKTLPVNKEFTMFANGDWLSSGQYKLVAKVSDGTYKRETSKTFNYVNNTKTKIRISAKDKKTFEVDLSRKGNVEVRDVEGKIVFSGKRPV
jgi:subtilisin family serine protease